MNNTIQKRRKTLGMTQVEVASLAKIPLRTYKRYEANQDSKEHRTPDATVAIRIARTLDTTVENLWGTIT